MAEFELKQTDSGKYVWNLKAGNGQVILTSESYDDKAKALAEIEAARAAAQNPGSFQKKTSASGDAYFTLVDASGNGLGRSEMYSSASARDSGIESVEKNAPGAKLDDLTA